MLSIHLYSDKEELQKTAVQYFRKQITTNTAGTVKHMVEDKSIIPRLINILKTSNNTQIQFEVAWILTNIASVEDNSKLIIDSFHRLSELINSTCPNVCEMCVWAIGNLAENRSLMLQMNIIPRL